MKKVIISESKRKAEIEKREKAILESFSKIFNKIKRIDENYYEESQEPIEEIKSDYLGGEEEGLNVDERIKDSLLDDIAFKISYGERYESLDDNLKELVYKIVEKYEDEINRSFNKFLDNFSVKISDEVKESMSQDSESVDTSDLPF
jgi:hypothetical protein